MHEHDDPGEHASQLALFPQPPRRSRPSPPPVSHPTAPPAGGDEPTDDSQEDLFAAPMVLRVEIERAIAAADFDEACRLRDRLAAEHGASWVPGDLEFLGELIPCPWDPLDVAALLSGWRRAQPRLATPGRRRQLADAMFGRLVGMRLEDDVVRHDASCLTDVLRAMWRGRRADDARMFLRDALLRGEEPDPEAIDDSVIRDVLAEPRSSRWLASVGAMRGAWKAPRMNANELATWQDSLAAPMPEADDDRARCFWECLRVVAMRGTVPEPLFHAARQRMKALDPEA